jgi:hypothetical protein
MHMHVNPQHNENKKVWSLDVSPAGSQVLPLVKRRVMILNLFFSVFPAPDCVGELGHEHPRVGGQVVQVSADHARAPRSRVERALQPVRCSSRVRVP